MQSSHLTDKIWRKIPFILLTDPFQNLIRPYQLSITIIDNTNRTLSCLLISQEEQEEIFKFADNRVIMY